MSIGYTNLYKLLSDVSRRRILAVLNRAECSVQDLQEVLSMGQSSISAHLAQLRTNNLIHFRKHGRFTLYHLANNTVDTVSFLSSILDLLSQEEWYEKDARKLEKLLQEKETNRISFYESLETQNKRSPGQTDLSFALGLLRIIRDMVIVDIGCGAGKIARELAKMGNKVIGIDIDKKQIALAKKTLPKNIANISFQLGDGTSMNIESSSVDIVLFSHSLHHIENPYLAIQEASRILHPQGKILILDLVQHNENWTTKIFGDIHLGFDSKKLLQYLQEIGFGNVSFDIDASDSEYPQFESLIITAEKIK